MLRVGRDAPRHIQTRRGFLSGVLQAKAQANSNYLCLSLPLISHHMKKKKHSVGYSRSHLELPYNFSKKRGRRKIAEREKDFFFKMLLKNLAICLSLLLFLPPDAFGQGNKRLLLYNYTVCAVKKKNPLPCVQQTKKTGKL